jgi:hypothetical protein
MSARSNDPYIEDLDARIHQWVADLGSENTEVAESAQHGLAHLGPRVLDRVVAAVPRLGRFGQLCAIEIFTELGDPGPAAALIELLASEHTTVREWAAEALAELRIEHAVPAIQAAYAAFRRSGERPDHSEGVGLRRALTVLGARDRALPPEAAALQTAMAPFEQAWPFEHLEHVIDRLAEHSQAVLYFQLWQILPDGRAIWQRGSEIDWGIDRNLSWSQIVSDCRDWAQLAATAITPRADLVATVEWIAATDV